MFIKTIKRMIFMIMFLLLWVADAYTDDVRFEEGKVSLDLPYA